MPRTPVPPALLQIPQGELFQSVTIAGDGCSGQPEANTLEKPLSNRPYYEEYTGKTARNPWKIARFLPFPGGQLIK
jgi:hypothetical protein